VGSGANLAKPQQPSILGHSELETTHLDAIINRIINRFEKFDDFDYFSNLFRLRCRISVSFF